MTDVERARDEALEAARAALAREPSSACLLDSAGRIVDVNEAWEAFAAANGGARCTLEALRGTRYDAHVEGAGPRARTAAQLARSLHGEAHSVDSECSSAEVFRLLRTHYVPVQFAGGRTAAGVLVIHTVRREGPLAELHQPHPADEAAYRPDHGVMVMCSSCRRVRRHRGPPGWDYVPAWVARLPDAVSHGLCSTCVLQYGFFDPEPVAG